MKSKVTSHVAGSVLLGGLTAVTLKKVFDVSKKSSITGGIITGAAFLLIDLIQGFNGHYKAKYLSEKRKFEKE